MPQDPGFNSAEAHPLEPEEFENFIHRRGVFSPRILPNDVHPVAGIRLITQINAKHPETFTPQYISLRPELYIAMIEALRLPRVAIETSGAVGPLFWHSLDDADPGNPSLQMVYRKSDVRKRGYTRGWEVILSHEFRTGITTGFCKGTKTSDIAKWLAQLKDCTSEIGHAILLPTIIISNESSPAVDSKQRDGRAWLRKLEQAIAMRTDTSEVGGYACEGAIDLNAVNRDLVECHAQVLWKPPTAYICIIDAIKQSAQLFMETLPEERRSPAIQRFQKAMLPRLELYRTKWSGVDLYVNTTLQRLEIQRNALYACLAQKESRLNLSMAADQKRLAHTSKRESESMKGISLVGAFLLPPTFLASIFSTTFFNFQEAPDISSAVSPRFWLYWIVAIPLTLLTVALYLIWEKRRLRTYNQEEKDLEEGMGKMEEAIMKSMRVRTLSKVTTWDARTQRKERLASDPENDYGAFKEPVPAAISNKLAVPQA